MPTASKKSQILKRKAKQFFLTRSASEKSQISQIWRQKNLPAEAGCETWGRIVSKLAFIA